MPVKFLEMMDMEMMLLLELNSATASQGVQIISMSLGGGGYNSYLDNSISYAVDQGTTVFAATVMTIIVPLVIQLVTRIIYR